MSEWKAFASGESEYRFRQLMTYVFRQEGTGLAVNGVLPAPSALRLKVIQTATASSSILVNRGALVWQGANADGVHPMVNDTTKTIDVLGPSPMAALPRNDLVIFNVDDAAIQVVVGSPNASPVDPAVSANHVKLARIRNAANATTIPDSAIDDLRVFTTLNGVPVTLSGTVTLTGDATNQRFVDVSFSSAFPGTPVIVLQALTGMSSSATTQSVWPSNESASGFRVNGVRNNTTSISVRWFAYYG